MNVEIPSYKIKTPIRNVSIDNISIGGDSSISFMSENNNKTTPLFALEIPFLIDETYPKEVFKFWREKDLTFDKLLNLSMETNADLICIKFNFDETTFPAYKNNIETVVKNIVEKSNKPIIFRGTNKKEIDVELLPIVAESAKKQTIISFVDEETYDKIIPAVAKNNHLLVLRSPIDINLAKELNILATDLGMDADKLLIDPDMGGLGYGLDYGYSIIEKIKQAGFEGDKMLNMPMILFVGEETFKAKETKSNQFDSHWGHLGERAVMWEIASASALISAGANIVVMQHPTAIKNVKETVICN